MFIRWNFSETFVLKYNIYRCDEQTSKNDLTPSPMIPGRVRSKHRRSHLFGDR